MYLVESLDVEHVIVLFIGLSPGKIAWVDVLVLSSNYPINY